MNNKQIAIIQGATLCPQLTPIEKRVVENSLTPKVKDIETRSISEPVLDEISKAVLRIGNKNLTEQDISFMASEVSQEVKRRFPHVKIGEVLQAIKNGSFGEYQKDGDILFLSTVNVFKWVEQYQYNKHVAIARQIEFEQKEIEQKMEEQKTNESVKKYWSELGGRIAEQVNRVEGERNSPMSSVWFESLESLSLIKLTIEEKKKFLKDAEIEMSAEYRARRVNIKKIGDLFGVTAKKRAKENAFYSWLKSNPESQEEIKEEINRAVNHYKKEIFN